MNHGRCKNCWWYLQTEPPKWTPTKWSLILKPCGGRCYMHVGSDGVPYTMMDGASYCPDYINRKRGDKEQGMTLSDWIKGLPAR